MGNSLSTKDQQDITRYLAAKLSPDYGGFNFTPVSTDLSVAPIMSTPTIPKSITIPGVSAQTQVGSGVTLQPQTASLPKPVSLAAPKDGGEYMLRDFGDEDEDASRSGAVANYVSGKLKPMVPNFPDQPYRTVENGGKGLLDSLAEKAGPLPPFKPGVLNAILSTVSNLGSTVAHQKLGQYDDWLNEQNKRASDLATAESQRTSAEQDRAMKELQMTKLTDEQARSAESRDPNSALSKRYQELYAKAFPTLAGQVSKLAAADIEANKDQFEAMTRARGFLGGAGGAGAISTKPLTEAEGKALNYYATAKLASDAMESVKFDPTSTTNALPLPNVAKSKERQQFETAQANYVTAMLRDESGAAISDPEYVRKVQESIPKWGDSPETVQMKANLRHQLIAVRQLRIGLPPDQLAARLKQFGVDINTSVIPTPQVTRTVQTDANGRIVR